MITFYPRPLALWGKDFDFFPSILCIPKEKTDHKIFRNRSEFIEFLKNYGIRLDDSQNPLMIKPVNDGIFTKGNIHQGEPFVVIKFTVIGWIRDNYVG